MKCVALENKVSINRTDYMFIEYREDRILLGISKDGLSNCNTFKLNFADQPASCKLLLKLMKIFEAERPKDVYHL